MYEFIPRTYYYIVYVLVHKVYSNVIRVCSAQCQTSRGVVYFYVRILCWLLLFYYYFLILCIYIHTYIRTYLYIFYCILIGYSSHGEAQSSVGYLKLFSWHRCYEKYGLYYDCHTAVRANTHAFLTRSIFLT